MIFSGQINAQNLSPTQLDSLYNKFIQIIAPEFSSQRDQNLEINIEDRKCGFITVTDVKANYDFFNSEQQVVVNSFLQRPPLQTSIVSSSGFFRIHYDETGINRPSYTAGTIEQNVAQVAEALDSVYRFEIGYLRFLSPPGDNGAGGDDKYDIYIQDQGAGSGVVYGYTQPEFRVGQVSWTSYMVIDNDFPSSEYYTSGLGAMRVTVAHEFHHGIQVGSYSIPVNPTNDKAFRDEDRYFYELTSTSMEEFVFDNVNDYYGYMRSYFQYPNRPFASQSGYNMAIWNLYLQKRFGYEILRKQWELIPSINAILAINNSIVDAGSYFPGELNKFGIWTYYTNVRSIPGQYFEESSNYPLITPTSKLNYNPPQLHAQGSIRPTANYFLKFTIASTGDSLYSIITNGDAYAASVNSNQYFEFDYTLFSDTTSGSRILTDNYSSTFSTANPNYWSVSEILNNLLVRSDSALVPTVEVDESLVFPNPFRYSVFGNSSEASINITLNMQSGTEVDFNVYSSGLQLVYSRSKTVGPLLNNSLGIYWNALDNNNNKLGSGVYIYVIKQGDEVIKGKVVIFDE